jgi:hypothetical protein
MQQQVYLTHVYSNTWVTVDVSRGPTEVGRSSRGGWSCEFHSQMGREDDLHVIPAAWLSRHQCSVGGTGLGGLTAPRIFFSILFNLILAL